MSNKKVLRGQLGRSNISRWAFRGSSVVNAVTCKRVKCPKCCESMKTQVSNKESDRGPSGFDLPVSLHWLRGDMLACAAH